MKRLFKKYGALLFHLLMLAVMLRLTFIYGQFEFDYNSLRLGGAFATTMWIWLFVGVWIVNWSKSYETD